MGPNGDAGLVVGAEAETAEIDGYGDVATSDSASDVSSSDAISCADEGHDAEPEISSEIPTQARSDDMHPGRRNPSQRRTLHASASSLLMAGAFAPPFYNRPPTPLPPSPSLTSLLRPPFSTTTSRPSTPDDSEADTLNDAESAVVAKSARIASAVPRASPKVPTYEYYGFVLYLLSSLCFLIYLLWSYLPSPFLKQLGIDYYPNRWWSLAIPAFLVMLIVYIYIALAAYNTGYLTYPMDKLENFVDDAAQIAVLDRAGNIVRSNKRHESPLVGMQNDNVSRRSHRSRSDLLAAWSKSTDAVMDVPIGGICDVLYASGED